MVVFCGRKGTAGVGGGVSVCLEGAVEICGVACWPAVDELEKASRVLVKANEAVLGLANALSPDWPEIRSESVGTEVIGRRE